MQAFSFILDVFYIGIISAPKEIENAFLLLLKFPKLFSKQKYRFYFL